MKRNLIFYPVLLAFLAGGVLWTNYSIEKRRNDEYNKVNHYQEVNKMLAMTPQVTGFQGKDIVFYAVSHEDGEHIAADLARLGKIQAGHPEVLVVAVGGTNQEHLDNYIPAAQRPQNVQVVSSPLLWNMVYKKAANFYKNDKATDLMQKSPGVILITREGKIPGAWVGRDENPLAELEKELR